VATKNPDQFVTVVMGKVGTQISELEKKVIESNNEKLSEEFKALTERFKDLETKVSDANKAGDSSGALDTVQQINTLEAAIKELQARFNISPTPSSTDSTVATETTATSDSAASVTETSATTPTDTTATTPTDTTASVTETTASSAPSSTETSVTETTASSGNTTPTSVTETTAIETSSAGKTETPSEAQPVSIQRKYLINKKIIKLEELEKVRNITKQKILNIPEHKRTKQQIDFLNSL
jgi:hypothetical protein